MNMNPVLLKELKVRMRGWRAAAMIALYLLVLASVAVFIMYTTYMNPYSATVGPQVSTGAYSVLAIFQFILILFIAPALTAGAISGEREKQTLDLVLCTRLKPYSLIVGKLFASLSQIILLIAASLPVFSTVFLFGGISMLEILQLFGFYIVTALTMGCIGIFFSTYLKRTTAATVLTYGVVAFLTLGTLFITVIYLGMVYNMSYDRFFPLLYMSPVAGFSSLLADQFGSNINAILGFRTTSAAAQNMPQPWQINILVDLGLSALLVALSAYRINPVRRGLFARFKGKKQK